MNLICLTGIDGAGKTTLAHMLVESLRTEGKSAVYLYGRTYPVVSRVLMALGRVTLLRKHDQWQDYKSYTADKKQAMHNPLLAAVYRITILLDYYPQIWWKLLPHLFTRRTIVLDRYVYDTVISDLTVHLNYSDTQTRTAIEHSLKLVPVPQLTAVIDLPADVAFKRKDDVPHIDYLEERRSWYLCLTDRPEVIRVDGESSPENVLMQIRQHLEQKRNEVVSA